MSPLHDAIMRGARRFEADPEAQAAALDLKHTIVEPAESEAAALACLLDTIAECNKAIDEGVAQRPRFLFLTLDEPEAPPNQPPTCWICDPGPCITPATCSTNPKGA